MSVLALLGCAAMGRLALLSTLVLLPLLMLAQVVPQDTLPIFDLPGAEVRVDTARQSELRPSYLPRTHIDVVRAAAFGGADFTARANRIPGVRFESRAPGSYRIGIRGTSRRSPFGVRDVQVYWNHIPLTEPGGDTPLNFIEPALVDRLGIIKGSGAVAAGSPLGGVVSFDNISSRGLGAQVEVGSFGSSLTALRIGTGDTSSTRVDMRAAYRSSNGYRDHSALRRTVVQASLVGAAKRNTSKKLTLSTSTHVLATQLDYELPGGLTPEQYADNPRQARPGSAEADASIAYKSVLIGVNTEGKLGDLSFYTVPYLTGFTFDNPFNINYKRETNFGTGIRGGASYQLNRIPYVSSMSAGGTAQIQYRDARQYDPSEGEPGELQYSDDIYSDRYVGYGLISGEFALASASPLRYQAGLSVLGTSYQVDRTFERGASASSSNRRYDAVWSPVVSVTGDFLDAFLTLSYAGGSSSPTLREFRTNEGSLNNDLAPERGQTLELFGSTRLGRSIILSGNVYYTRLSQTITTFQDSSGVQLFRNAGEVDQPGVEVSTEYLVNSSSISLAYTYQPYQYRAYEVDGVSFAGRPLPGLPEHTLDALAHAALVHDLYLDFNLRYEAQNPLDDAGEVSADAFWLTRLQGGWRSKVWHLYAAVDNLFDITYSLGNDINPQFGRRYFQPAAGRGVFFGISYLW